MRPVHYLVAVTLDGFIADPEGGVDAFVAEGDHVDHYLATIRRYDTVVMGRKTYDFGRGPAPSCSRAPRRARRHA
jgi:dihydrofolate reductase